MPNISYFFHLLSLRIPTVTPKKSIVSHLSLESVFHISSHHGIKLAFCNLLYIICERIESIVFPQFEGSFHSLLPVGSKKKLYSPRNDLDPEMISTPK